MGSYKKKLSIVLLLFLLINFYVCSSVNAVTSQTEYYTFDMFEFFQNQQLYLSHMFFYYLNQSNISDTQKNELKEKFKNKFYYFYTYNTSSSQFPNIIIVCFYEKNLNYNYLSTNSNNTYITEDDYLYDPNYLADESGYIIPCERRQISTYDNVYASIANYNIKIPSLLIGYQNDYVKDFVNGLDFNGSYWNLLQQAIQENTESQDETTQAVNNLRNDFNEEESDEDYSFPTNNPTQDTAEASIDAVFTLFYDKINAWSSAQMQIPIPFTGKHFNIPPNLTQNIINGFPAGNVISRLLGLIWYYLLGVYIIKDVQKYIDGLQTGEILTKSDTNIKTEML